MTRCYADDVLLRAISNGHPEIVGQSAPIMLSRAGIVAPTAEIADYQVVCCNACMLALSRDDRSTPPGNTERIRHTEALQAKWRARKHLQTEGVTAWAVALAHHLGLPLHPSKSKLTQAPEIDFLGMHLKSTRTEVVIQLTLQRRASLLSQLRQLRRRLRNARPVSPRAIAAFTGLASASVLAVPIARPLLRHIFALQSAAVVAVGWSGSWRNVPAVLSRPAIAELCELKLLFRAASLSSASLINNPGRPAVQPPDCILT